MGEIFVADHSQKYYGISIETGPRCDESELSIHRHTGAGFLLILSRGGIGWSDGFPYYRALSVLLNFSSIGPAGGAHLRHRSLRLEKGLLPNL